MRVLCLARNYPNNVLPRLGLWTERLVRACESDVDIRVLAPVPFWPPVPGPDTYAKFRRVDRRERRGSVEVLHPRFVTGPAYWLHALEAWPYSYSVTRAVDRLRGEFPFDLIHAHSVYPDGWTAARLARRYRVPLIITEHSSWSPWLDVHRSVRRRAVWAAGQSTFVIAVSRALRDTISRFIDDSGKLRVIPNAVDSSVFGPARGESPFEPNRLLFVGLLRHVKGVDLLLQAVRLLADRGRPVSLTVIGDSFYARHERDYEDLRRLSTTLGLDGLVTFLGGKPPAEVARAMRTSALLVLPSRRETFGSVLAEALACGTPVVATRCGGTEDIVNDRVGVLVPPENPAALADGIAQVLDRRAGYDPNALRAYALDHFGLEVVGRKLCALYQEAVGTAGAQG